VITVWTRLQPDYAANMWNEALNKRLNTEVTNSLITGSEKFPLNNASSKICDTTCSVIIWPRVSYGSRNGPTL